MVNRGSETPQEKPRWFISYSPGADTGVTWGDQGRVQGERGRTPGHMALLVLWGSRAKARLVNTTKRTEVLVCYVDLLSGGAQGEGRGRRNHRGYWENRMKNLGLLVTAGYCVRHALA